MKSSEKSCSEREGSFNLPKGMSINSQIETSSETVEYTFIYMEDECYETWFSGDKQVCK